jgi:hypothetical protein
MDKAVRKELPEGGRIMRCHSLKHDLVCPRQDRAKTRKRNKLSLFSAHIAW